MKKLKTFLIITLVGLIISLAYNRVQSHAVNPPVENTGAPGESTCQSCHSSYNLNSGTGNVTIVLDSSKYQDDSTYLVTVTVKDTTKKIYGFQLTALNTSNDAAGTFTLINTSTTNLQTGDSPKRYYVDQHSATASNVWTFKWTAPASDSGVVTFYACGVAANDNGNSAGDEVYTSNLKVKFDTITNTIIDTDTVTDTVTVINISKSLFDNKALVIYPMPTTNFINLCLPINESFPIEITLFDITGKVKSKWNFISQPLGQFKQQLQLNESSLQNGLYLLNIKIGQNEQSQKILIQNN
jgi:hypothetical protein